MSTMADLVAGSTSNSSCAANRAARSIRSGSSSKERSGSIGVRSTRRREILQAAVRVDHCAAGVERQLDRHRVDGEVPPGQVALDGVAEVDLRLAGLAVVGVGAVGRDLAAVGDSVDLDLHTDRAERDARRPSRS